MMYGSTITHVLGGFVRRRTLDRKGWHGRLLTEQRPAQTQRTRLRPKR